MFTQHESLAQSKSGFPSIHSTVGVHLLPQLLMEAVILVYYPQCANCHYQIFGMLSQSPIVEYHNFQH